MSIKENTLEKDPLTFARDLSEKSKNIIVDLIKSNKAEALNAINVNGKLLDSINEKLLEQGGIKDIISDAVKETFSKSLELSENTIDSIVGMYNKQLEVNIELNTKLVDSIRGNPKSVFGNVEKIMKENLENSQKINIDSTKEIIDVFNKHSDLSKRFNENLEKAVNSQVKLMTEIQNKRVSDFKVSFFNFL
jgi:hypothetical protein